MRLSRRDPRARATHAAPVTTPRRRREDVPYPPAQAGFPVRNGLSARRALLPEVRPR
jgi:hypothetical protein